MQTLPQFLSYQAEIFSSYYTRYVEQNQVLDFYILATFQKIISLQQTPEKLRIMF